MMILAFRSTRNLICYRITVSPRVDSESIDIVSLEDPYIIPCFSNKFKSVNQPKTG